MEETGGEPGIIAVEPAVFILGDCSGESPAGRRNMDYDQSAEMAKKMGIEMMDEITYMKMRDAGLFD